MLRHIASDAQYAFDNNLVGMIQAHVPIVRSDSQESFITVLAFEHVLADVHRCVLLHVPRVRERLLAVRALVRPFPGVHPLVPRHAARRDEPLPAVLARVRLDAGVDALVRLDVARVRETLIAEVAVEGPFPAV